MSEDYILLAAKGLSAAQAVEAQAESDYPKDSLKWMSKIDWSWPKAIPLNQIDFSNKASWDAEIDPKKVKKFEKKITKGVMKPAILIKPKGKSKYVVVDGHHRALSCLDLNRPLMAWTADGPTPKGPWDDFHDQQTHLSIETDMTDLEIVLLAVDSMQKASTPQPFSKNPLWHKKPLHLPNYVQHVAHALLAHGHASSESEAIAMAIGIIKKWAQKKPEGGEKTLHSDTQAAAAKAVAEWEADRAATKGGKK